MLELTALTKSFGRKIAVKGVTLTIPKGQMVGIIGRSGAGKSTLLRLINRLAEPDSGSVRFGGQEVSRLKGGALRLWRRRSAMIFQQFNLIPRLDVLTNVLTGTLAARPLPAALLKLFPREARLRAIRELDALDMAQTALQRAATLSGGQQQRVAIARALMQDPDIMLADEPIASLDPMNAEIVMQALARVNAERGITVIVNLHALDIARRFCPRIVGLSAGKIVFDGPPEALTQDAVERIYNGRPGPQPVAVLDEAA